MTDDQLDAALGGEDPTAKVFISYSRKDRARAQNISDALRARSFGVFRDTEDILPTEEWQERLEQLIYEADTIVFLLSPHSAVSEVCQWEIDLATSLNKRIAPIVIEEVDTNTIPAELAKLNFIFCTERDRFEDAVDSLISALNTDVDWVREHTRIANLAKRWADAGEPRHLLLRGQDVADAEAWRDGHPNEAPALTAQQLSFVGASRAYATALQRRWIGGSVAVSLAMVVLAVFAVFQSNAADEAALAAQASERSAYVALSRIAADQGEFADATRLALAALSRGDDDRVPSAAGARTALIEALPHVRERRTANALSGTDETAEYTLRSAYSNGGEIVSLWYRAFIDPTEAATLVQIHNAQSFEPRMQFEIPGLLLALPFLSGDGRYLAVRDSSGVPPSAYLIDLQDAVTTSLDGAWPVAPDAWTWSIATGPFAALTGEGPETRLAIVDRFIDDPQAEAKRSFVDAQIAELEDRGLAAVLSDDLALFAIAYVEDENSRIRVLDLNTQSVIASFATPGRVEALGFDLERNQITALARVETRSAPYFSAWSFRAVQKTGEGATIGDARLAPEFVDRYSRFALGQVPGTGNILRALDLQDGSAALDGFDLGADTQDLYQSAISTNGETAILVQDTAISVVDVADARIVFSTPLDDFIQVTRVGGLAVSDNGNWAAYAFEGEIIVVNARTGTEHARLLVLETPNPIVSLAFLPESTDLVFSHPTGIAGVWPIDAPEARFQIRAPDRLEFDDISVSEDGRWLAVEVFRSLNTVAVHIYDTATGALVRVLDMPPDTEGTLVKSHFSPDGTRLAARGPGGEIFMWDTATGILILRLSLEPGTGQVTGFTEDGEGLITWSFPAADASDQAESAQSFVWSIAHLARGTAYEVACDLLAGFDPTTFSSLDIALTDPVCVSETTKGAP